MNHTHPQKDEGHEPTALMVVTKRLEGVIREVMLRGEQGRWQMRFALEETLGYAEFLLRPLGQGPMTDKSMLRAKECVLTAWDQAMIKLYPDVDERMRVNARIADFWQSSYDVRPADVESYLNAIAGSLRRYRGAA